MSKMIPGAVCYLDPSHDEQSLARFEPRERAILHDINRRVAAARSLPELLDYIFESTKSMWPTDRLSVAFLEPDGRLVSGHTIASYPGLRLREGYSQDLSESSLRRVLESGQPRLITDLEQYLAEHPGSHSTRLIVSEGLRSSMTCPLVIDGRPIGLLFRSSKHLMAYTPRHVILHSAVAERMSQAVEKAYHIEQLTRANEAYQEMLAFVSHELKNPVASIVMDGELLTKGYLGDLNSRQRDKVQRMVDKCKYLLSLVREYLDLARLESGELQARIEPQVDIVARVVEPAIDLVAPQLHSKNLWLERNWAPELPCVDCDPNLMTIVMTNLLGNAIKYSRDGGRVRISLSAARRRFHLAVFNEGPGFPPEQRNRLFRRFSRLDDPALAKQPGTGVGLYNCWRIVHQHKGKIGAKSEYGQWAEFHLFLPLTTKVHPSADSSDKA